MPEQSLEIYKKALEFIKNKIANSPNFSKTEFFELFKKEFKDKLSENGLNVYATCLDRDALNATFEKFDQELESEYMNLLDLVEKDALANFDPYAASQKAQSFFQSKLEGFKATLCDTLNDRLTEKGKIFNDSDKKELANVLNKYVEDCGKKVNRIFKEIEGVWSKAAEIKSSVSIEEQRFKAENPNATFGVQEVKDLGGSIGERPNSVTGIFINKPNLTDQVAYSFASSKGGTINLTATIPNEEQIFNQCVDIASQHRSPILALIVALMLLILKLVTKHEQRMVDTVKEFILKNRIIINPKNVTITIEVLNSNGKKTFIKKKVPLSTAQKNDLHQANEKVRAELKENAKSGYSPEDKGYSSCDSDTKIDEIRRSTPSIRC